MYNKQCNPGTLFYSLTVRDMFFSTVLATITQNTPHYYTSAILHHLQLAIYHQSLKLTQQSHALTLTLNLSQNPFIITKLISSYATCQHPKFSQLVFNSTHNKNIFLYNTLINGYVKNSEFSYALQLFVEMRESNFIDDFTLSIVSKLCGMMGELRVGEYVHGKCVRIGFVNDVIVANSLISMYGKCRVFDECMTLFDEMPERNSGSWNAIMGEGLVCRENVWRLVKEMQLDGVRPDAYTISSILPLCERLDYGRELHCYIVKNELELGSGLGSDVHLGCCLVDMYSRLNNVLVGRRVFDHMEFRNVFAWTAMISGYVNNGDMYEALKLFKEMQGDDGVEPNWVSLMSVLPACSSLAGLIGGKQIHGFVIRRQLNGEASLCNALIDMYCKCGSLGYARRIFEDDSFCKDAVSWSSMISGYGLHGNGQGAVFMFDKMLCLGIKPDMITVVGVLSACGRSGLVNEGLSIYNAATNDYGIKPTFEICSCIVDMLGRSGKLDQALDFIKKMPVEPGPSVWGALVSASITHGNTNMRELAYKCLIQIEPENPSNYVSLSNLYASSRNWEYVAGVRTMMKEKGLRKLPGCSWININCQSHCFYVADKGHQCSSLIYEMLDNLTFMIKRADYSPGHRYLT